MRLVIVESPYAARPGQWPPILFRWLNRRYARACVRDCLLRDEAPLASHLLYTQPGVLRDGVAAERAHGINAGLHWGRHAQATVVYIDRGISPGMRLGIDRAEREGRPVLYRALYGLAKAKGAADVATPSAERAGEAR